MVSRPPSPSRLGLKSCHEAETVTTQMMTYNFSIGKLCFLSQRSYTNHKNTKNDIVSIMMYRKGATSSQTYFTSTKVTR